MYYLNAFNEMLRKRQQQNNMMGGGQDYGISTTAPSGPLGLGPAQDRSGWRDALNNMSPAVSFGLGMVPGVGRALGAARLANAGISAYESSQLAPSRDARERSQDQFRAFEIADMNAPMQNTAQQSFQTGEKNYGFFSPSVSDFQRQADEISAANSGRVSAPTYASSYSDDTMDRVAGVTSPDPVAVNAPVSSTSISGESLGAADTSYGGFGDVTGGSNTMGFAGTYAHGGMVHARHLKGRAPAPDDGYGALQGGEYVITKAAVEKYGKKLLDAINNGTFR